MNDVTRYGATGDGITDDGAAIRAAVKTGGVVYFPPGVYYYRSGGSLNLATGTTLRGEPGASTILFDNVRDGYVELFNVSGDHVHLHGLTVRKVADFPTVMIPTRPTTGLTITSCVFDGGRTRGSKYTHGLSLGAHTGTMTGLTIRDTTFTGFSYPLYQANNATGTTRDIRIRDCVFTGNYATDLELNAPTGLIANVRVVDCDFTDNLAGAPGAGFAIGLAHVIGTKIRGNTFDGYGNEAVHVEDHSSDTTVHDNTFTRCGADRAAHIRVLSGSTGVRVTGNHFDAADNTTPIPLIQSTAGGTGLTPGGRESTHPQNITVQGNTFLAGICDGVYASFCDGFMVTGNTFHGSTGRAVDAHKGAGVIAGNTTHGYATPFRVAGNGVLVTGNQTEPAQG